MLTATESAFLGIAFGGTITWLTGWYGSRAQWGRDEQRRILDRKAALYEETLMTMDRLERAHALEKADELPDDYSDEELRTAWNARLRLYASGEVVALWNAWLTSLITGEHRSNAEHDLVVRMRTEVGDSTRLPTRPRPPDDPQQAAAHD